ncbi:adenylyl-sulfate kinase [Aureimonas phyllosphaerae]|uniref:Adenylyl-sulfate kinase n=1 Tax=Aureimonas phyllosphaerae TaxID=1166078 RepID=A0A7W6BQZ6_9HYPH|nr:adenylyl-sulfate kinase [Aureimonas phyllosphaerae]MBB3936484.1 bifunctional enzyme CysN/CysC [Aureimonas phyllosphaerae]MBB3960652.1 bifunctional enzyme CysN/CysC [Aureimonas phyllosphaerae]SFF29623.1 bifunctional enzyme CysN/CysC [Aureimonas phyllosphaerae]
MPPHAPEASAPLRLLLCGLRGGGDIDLPNGSIRGRPLMVSDLRGTDDPGALARAGTGCEAAVVVSDRPLRDVGTHRLLEIVRLIGLDHMLVLVESPDGEETPPSRTGSAAAREPGEVTVTLGRNSADLLRHLDDWLDSLPDVAPSPDAPFRVSVSGAPSAQTAVGTIVAGSVRPGDRIAAVETGRVAGVLAVEVEGEARAAAGPGDTATIRFDAPLGPVAGDVLAAAGDRPETCDQFAADLLWLDPDPLLPGRAYRIEIGPRQVAGSVTRIKHRIAGDGAGAASSTFRAGDRGRVNLSLAQSIAFEPFERNRVLGTFMVADTASGRTVGVGTIDFALRRAANIHRQAVDVTKAARAAAKAQRPALLWFTGLSGAGKSTIANLVEKRLFALGHHTYLLDGDNVRHGLNRDLGFTAADRVENIRRVAETAKLMVDAGLITLASFISPFRAERQLARDLLAEGEFVEVFVDAPLGVVEARDPKGLYAQARAGRIPNFTGIDSPYEPPAAPELHLETHRRSADELADEVVTYLDRAGFLYRTGG